MVFWVGLYIVANLKDRTFNMGLKTVALLSEWSPVYVEFKYDVLILGLE